jgi:hypothetical protein
MGNSEFSDMSAGSCLQELSVSFGRAVTRAKERCFSVSWDDKCGNWNKHERKLKSRHPLFGSMCKPKAADSGETLFPI